jgi:predicted DNA-binding transcriptional regulator AlpA
MTLRVVDNFSWTPRAMRVEAAAGYLGMSRSMFLRLVDEGVMPRPIKIGSMTTWDRLDLDAAYDALKEGDGKPSENTVHRRLKELQRDRGEG